MKPFCMLSKPDKNNKLLNTILAPSKIWQFCVSYNHTLTKIWKWCLRKQSVSTNLLQKKAIGEERGIMGLLDNEDTISAIVYIDSNLERKIFQFVEFMMGGMKWYEKFGLYYSLIFHFPKHNFLVQYLQSPFSITS